MHSAGARALREDDNEMSREAVLLQWERKIEVAERLEDDAADVAEPVPLRPVDAVPRGRFERSAAEPARRSESTAKESTGRFERTATEPRERPAPAASEPIAERRTITITGRPSSDQPAASRRRRAALVDAQLAQPDRIALWAFLMGLLLVAVAAGTAHA